MLPIMWRSEFLNVITTAVRADVLTLEQAHDTWHVALTISGTASCKPGMSHVPGTGQVPEQIAARCEGERDHDVRAALVCLLTAAFARERERRCRRQDVAGWFFLPAMHLWSEWARQSLTD